jgi:apoptosis-inducing factor 3
MGNDQATLTGPDFEQGISLSLIRDGEMLGGHAQGKPVLLARRGDELFAIGGLCTHYSAPLADGLMVGETVRCPWHHACFNLRTGAAERAPALNPNPVWNVEQRDGKVFVTGERSADQTPSTTSAAPRGKADAHPSSVLILGGGAAGDAAAQRLRLLGYDGPVTIVSADKDPPVDRPNLSKDYLAGTAQEEWIPLRPPSYYDENRIDLILGRRALKMDASLKRVTFDDGSERDFGALLIATGASPVQLPPAAAPSGRVHYLRSLADSRALIAASGNTKRVVILGASFIALEVAASLRGRGLEVHVVAPDKRPLERVLGPQIGDVIRNLHEENGVQFHLERTADRIDAAGATLSGGERIDAELIVAGIGVKPDESLAASAGLAVDRGIVVNARLETSVPGIFAAGDVARYPDPLTGAPIRVEHWVAAQRQGQAAAMNMLRQHESFTDVPFFWSKHYDLTINYVGHAESWDSIEIDGDPASGDFSASYVAKGRTLAVATAGRDRASLEAEVMLEGAARA